MGCHLALNWPMPANILDLFAEFRNLTNGYWLPHGTGLLGAMAIYGLDSFDAAEKKAMRNLAIRGGPFTAEERRQLLDYCESDVRCLQQLYCAMKDQIDLPRALIRGRYAKAVAHVEWTGTPIDVSVLDLLLENWEIIQERAISKFDPMYGVYEGRKFKAGQFARWLSAHNIPWPELESGNLALDDDTFRQQAKAHPEVAPLRELRHLLSQMRLNKLTVGKDGRNRCSLRPFAARNGRNQPSTNKFIFGPSVWIRNLIKPPPDYGLAYIDWRAQEFGIAAALSGDPAMWEAYASGDVYLAFAKQAGVAPPDATKRTHKSIRECFKQVVLGTNYSMGPITLAQRIGQTPAHAKRLIQLSQETYRDFWRWNDGNVDHAMLEGKLWTVFGWQINAGFSPNHRSMRNFLMSANGSEMLRLALCMATEQRIGVCAPVHDAILIEAPLEELDETVISMQEIMADASTFVLGEDYCLDTEAKVVRYPDRYMDERGAVMWAKIMEILRELGCDVDC
jgi:hypothetical protein